MSFFSGVERFILSPSWKDLPWPGLWSIDLMRLHYFTCTNIWGFLSNTITGPVKAQFLEWSTYGMQREHDGTQTDYTGKDVEFRGQHIIYSAFFLLSGRTFFACLLSTLFCLLNYLETHFTFSSNMIKPGSGSGLENGSESPAVPLEHGGGSCVSHLTKDVGNICTTGYLLIIPWVTPNKPLWNHSAMKLLSSCLDILPTIILKKLFPCHC